MRTAGVPLFALLLLLPIACGGGGGGTPMIKITGDNALAVAGNLTGGVRFLGELEEMLSDFVTVIEDPGASGTFPCPSAGTVTLDIGDLAPLGTISTGDTVRMTLDGCSVDLGEDIVSITGGLNFIVAESVDLPLGFDTTVRFTFSNFRMVMADETLTLNGDLSANRATTDEVVFTTTSSGNSLRVTIQDSVGTDSASITNFTGEQITNADLLTFTLDTSGTLYASDMGGKFAYETETILVGGETGPPEEGSLLVTGGGGTSMLFVILNEIDIELRVDGDGDGTRETIIETTWAEIEDS